MNNEDVSLNNINPSEPRNSLEKERLLEDREITNNITNNKETKKDKKKLFIYFFYNHIHRS